MRDLSHTSACSQHSRLRRENMAKFEVLSVTLCVGTPLHPYSIFYRRAYGISTRRLCRRSRWSPLCGLQPPCKPAGYLLPSRAGPGHFESRVPESGLGFRYKYLRLVEFFRPHSREVSRNFFQHHEDLQTSPSKTT